MTYATDGRCHNAEPGTYGHECGKPALWIGTDATGISSGFCDKCKRQGYEARNKVTWVPILPGTIDPRALAIAPHGITLTLDETGDSPMLIVTSTAPIPGGIMALCHALAGEAGAGIIFEGALR